MYKKRTIKNRKRIRGGVVNQFVIDDITSENMPEGENYKENGKFKANWINIVKRIVVTDYEKEGKEKTVKKIKTLKFICEAFSHYSPFFIAGILEDKNWDEGKAANFMYNMNGNRLDNEMETATEVDNKKSFLYRMSRFVPFVPFSKAGKMKINRRKTKKHKKRSHL